MAIATSKVAGASSAGAHASTLNRITASQPCRAGQALLQLQRLYGNRHVQRLLTLTRKANGDAEAAPEVEQAIQQARGGGQTLEGGVRAQMEPAFGADFSGVRVHVGAGADALNRSLNARAFTTGQNVFFRQGAYNAGSSSGRELLAHELTHVVQQTSDQVRRKLTVGQPGDRYEQEADQVAQAVMQQEQQPTRKDTDEGLAQRQVKEDEEEEGPIQTKVADAQLQQQVDEEEKEEPGQAKTEGLLVQRQIEEEEKEPVQARAEDRLVRWQTEEEEPTQAKTEEPWVQQQTKEDEKPIPTKTVNLLAKEQMENEQEEAQVQAKVEGIFVQRQRARAAIYIGQHFKQEQIARAITICSLRPQSQIYRKAQSRDNQPISRPVKVTVTLGPPGTHEKVIIIDNYDDLAEAYDEISSAMFFDNERFIPDEDSNPHWKKWTRYDDAVDELARWYATKKDKTQKPVPMEITEFENMLSEVRSVGQKCYRAFRRKDAEYKKKLYQAREKAFQAQNTAKQSLRLQFLGGASESDLTNNFLWSTIDHISTFAGTLTKAAEGPYIRTLGTLIPGAVTVANVVVNWSKTSPAMFGSGLEGLAALNNVINFGGGINSFFPNPAYIVTAYVGPMLAVISRMLGKLQMRLIEKNDEATAVLGNPTYIGAEPGGREMWDYMVNAMRATSPTEISQPTDAVYDYFDNFRDRFDAFNRRKYEAEMKGYRARGYKGETPFSPKKIPTESSWLIFSQVNPKQFPTWLYNNREMVWIVLYGSRDPTKARTI